MRSCGTCSDTSPRTVKIVSSFCKHLVGFCPNARHHELAEAAQFSRCLAGASLPCVPTTSCSAAAVTVSITPTLSRRARITGGRATCCPGWAALKDNERMRQEMTRMEQPSDIRQRALWPNDVAQLISRTRQAMRKHSDVSRLRFLLCRSGLLQEDEARIRKDDAGVVWVG